jgi:hypothetical protein
MDEDAFATYMPITAKDKSQELLGSLLARTNIIE